MTTWIADDGTEINFEVHGDRANRDALLLLPGLLGSIGSQWGRFVAPLSADFRVIIMDLRGHGRSTNTDSALTPTRMMHDVTGLLNHLQVSTTSVAGYDFGGYVGMMLALNEPNRVTSLLMHGTKFYWTEQAAKQMRQNLDPDEMATRVPAFADQLVKEHGGRHWRVLVRHAADLILALAHEGMTEGMVSRMRCAAIVSVGDRDEMIPILEAQRLSRVLPEGKLLVLPGVGHSFHTVRLVPLLPMMQFFHKTSRS